MRAQQEPLKKIRNGSLNRCNHRVKNEHRKGMKIMSVTQKAIIIA